MELFREMTKLRSEQYTNYSSNSSSNSDSDSYSYAIVSKKNSLAHIYLKRKNKNSYIYSIIGKSNNLSNINTNNINQEENNKFLKLVKDIASKGFIRSNYKEKLIDLSNVRLNLKSKK